MPARTALSAVAVQKQAEYEALLELNVSLNDVLGPEQLLAGGLDGGVGGSAALESFLMVAHEILDQQPALQPPE
eukprot:COSAG03_NODE_8504_length_796_cov_2.572453_1_plen_74_part_00